jgi:hypothetical protein
MLDEAAFIRTARRRSTKRIALVAGGMIVAALVVIALGVVGWHRGIYAHMQRIDWYYPTLVSISSPNTELMGPSITRSRFPGAVNEYSAYRRVGDVVVPAGEAFVEFDVWGGEIVRGVAERTVQTATRQFTGGDLAPTLRILAPADADSTAEYERDPESEQWTLSEIDKHSKTSLERLAAAPASATVEVAVSFADTLTLAEVEALLGPDLQLYWGATDAYERLPVPWEQGYGFMVGVDFARSGSFGPISHDTRRESEAALVSELKNIAVSAPKGTADRCLASAAYLEEHGVRYFAVVVCGSPEAASALAERPGVTAVSLGVVSMPWE